jgi:hypothetical protein
MHFEWNAQSNNSSFKDFYFLIDMYRQFVWCPPGLRVIGSCCWVIWGLRSLNAAFPCWSCLSYFSSIILVDDNQFRIRQMNVFYFTHFVKSFYKVSHGIISRTKRLRYAFYYRFLRLMEYVKNRLWQVQQFSALKLINVWTFPFIKAISFMISHLTKWLTT